MASDTTLRGALRRFGLDAQTHIGASWTYLLPNGEVAHCCWVQGRSISWPRGAPGTLTYRDTFDDFDPLSPSANARECFALLAAAQEHETPVRCIQVSGSKTAGTRYAPRVDLVGKVTMAIPEPGKGIEIAFRRQ